MDFPSRTKKKEPEGSYSYDYSRLLCDREELFYGLGSFSKVAVGKEQGETKPRFYQVLDAVGGTGRDTGLACLELP